MNMALKILAWATGCLVWGTFCFLTGLYLTFPSEAGLERLSFEVAERSRDEFAISAADLAPWGLGVAAQEVVLYRVKKGRRTKADEKPPLERTPFIELETLSVSARPLAFLLGGQGVNFNADFHDGTVHGFFEDSDSETTLSLHLADIDLGQIPYESAVAVLRLVGRLNVDVELVLNTEDVKSSTGSVAINFSGFGLAEGSEVGGFALPAVEFSEARLEMACEEGKLNVTHGEFVSPTLNATISGFISLQKRLSRSRNSLELAFTLPEDLDRLAQLSADLKRSRDGEGRYTAMISGTIFEWAFRLNRSGARSRSTALDDQDPLSKGIDRPRPVSGAGVAGRDDMTDEERRVAREERIKERRERLRQRREEAAKRRGEVVEGSDGAGIEPMDKDPDELAPDNADLGPPELPPMPDDEPAFYEDGNEEP